MIGLNRLMLKSYMKKLKNIKQIFDIVLLIQCFCKQGIPFLIRLFRSVFLFPFSKKMKIIRQHLVAMISPFWYFCSGVGSRIRGRTLGFLSAVIVKTKIFSKINSISGHSAAKTVIAFIQLILGDLSEWNGQHAMPVRPTFKPWASAACRAVTFPFTTSNTFMWLLSRNEKSTCHFQNENSKCLKVPYSILGAKKQETFSDFLLSKALKI